MKRKVYLDYRKQNSVTMKDAYPLLSIDDTLEALSEVAFLSTLDLASCYWSVGIDEDLKMNLA